MFFTYIPQRAASAACRKLLGASAVVIAAEGAWLAVSYKTPATPTGALSGVCEYEASNVIRGQQAAGEREAGAAASPADGSRFAAARELLRRHAPFLASPPPPPMGRGSLRKNNQPPPPPRLSVLVLGDSLVSGVGGDVQKSPPLAPSLASSLAARLRVDVSWKALGQTGADLEVRCGCLVGLTRC